MNRLGAYYATGYNNAVLIDDFGTETAVPYYPLEWLWNFPVVSAVTSHEQVAGLSEGGRGLGSLLRERANPQFNNPGGLLIPLFEFGVVGAVLFWLAAGSLLGAAYVRFRDASLPAVLIYPILVVGTLEIPRFIYWTQGRAFPAIVAALVLGGALAGAKRSVRRGEPSGPRYRTATDLR
jgi:hypothetical protein